MPLALEETEEQKTAAPPPSAASPDRRSLNKLSGPTIPSKPYGATNLEATDLGKLQDSLLLQMDEAGIPRPPQGMDLHPPTDTGPKAETGHANYYFIKGNADPNTLEADRKGLYTKSFPNQPPCDRLAVSLEADNAHTALHETTHYIAHHINKNGAIVSEYDPNLMDNTVGKIADKIRSNSIANGLDPTSPGAEDSINYMVKRIAPQIIERMADVSSTLYALSNYSDTNSVRAFYQSHADSTTARYFDDDHMTSSSIHAALDAYAKNPRKGMSIVETTKIAADIVGNDAHFDKDIVDINKAINVQELVNIGFEADPANPAGLVSTFAPEFDDLVKKPVMQEINETIQARNRFCRIDPVKP